MGLVLDWQKKLGYAKDPFEPGIPTPAKRFIVGLDALQERINLFLIKEERFGTIAGERGSGKSMLLSWVEEELAPQKTHAQHLLDAKRYGKRDEIVTALLSERLSFLERKFGKALKASAAEQEKYLLQRLAKERKNVLLIDNAGSLGKPELELFAQIAEKTPSHVIFTDTDERLKRLSLPDDLDDTLKAKIPEHTAEQLIGLLRRRIEAAGGSGTFPFDDEELSQLIKRSEKNPSKLLTLARERAIELSLKVKEIPRPAITEPAQTERDAESGVPREKKSTGFLSIRIAKAPAPSAQQPRAETQRRPEETTPDEKKEGTERKENATANASANSISTSDLAQLSMIIERSAKNGDATAQGGHEQEGKEREQTPAQRAKSDKTAAKAAKDPIGHEKPKKRFITVKKIKKK